MKKILVVFTGGTIGSKVQNKGVNVDKGQSSLLITEFFKNSTLEVEFKTIQPLNILSENATPKSWGILYNAIKQEDLSDIQGIIITHGSDTLPYTSAFISYTLSELPVPIVLTASNYPLHHRNSNGLRNFIHSVELILQLEHRGVFSVFEDHRGTTNVYLGTRMVEADSYHDQFACFGETLYGVMQNGTLTRIESNLNPTSQELENRQPFFAIGENEPYFHHRILTLKASPGLDYGYFHFGENKPAAILHSLYHSGTACTDSGQNSLPDYIRYCTENGVDSYLISFKNIEDDLYLTSHEILESGAIALSNISYEAAVVKLWLAYNIQSGNPKDFMQKNIYYEHLPQKEAL